MPPFFPVEDTSFETKQWASATIDTLFSDNRPVSFEPYKQPPLMKALKNNPSKLTAARRSVSVLETSGLDRSNDERVRPWDTSSSTSQSPTSYSDSAPSLLISHHHTHVSLSARLKRTLTLDKPYVTKKLLSFKEREGIDIWKLEFQQSLEDAKMLPHGQSPHLLHFILNELLTTEMTYLEHLLIVKQIFMDPLFEAATAYPRPLVNLRDIQTIFAFIPELISLSSALVNRLKDACCTTEQGETLGSLGKVFCDLEDQFAVYISYAANFSKQQRCISRADKSIVYRQLAQDSLRKKETNRMGLSNYMIAPIQRITRYGLLLKDIAKHSNPECPDFVFIRRSLKCHLALAHAMNEIQ
ncbi:Dbl homology domain-containing protein [Helicostylum pulchrum]|nr:Dbl homology domain-containing protein [Helicostylum pulchrum]